jgi:methanogenic corrinoid protein MtbC1
MISAGVNSVKGETVMVSEKRKREILDAIRDAVVQFDEDQSAAWCRTVLQEGLDAYEATMKGLAAGMDRVGVLYTEQEYFVPELLLCSDAPMPAWISFAPISNGGRFDQRQASHWCS